MISDFFALIGSICFLSASIGLFRMPDAFSRIHAATKASSLGILCLVIAVILEFSSISAVLISVLILILVFLTAPMACHAISIKLLKKQ